MAKKAMTTRQREFCHHYAHGLSGSKAAHAAGYAKSTSEHNAALLLRNPQVIYTITLLQQGTREQVMEIFLKAKKRACHTLDYDSSDKAVESASREMRHWCKILLTLPPDRSLLPPLEESTQDDEPPVVGTHCVRPEPAHAGQPSAEHNSQSTSIKQKPQTPKNQNKKSATQRKITPEKDQLPDGREAFDIQLSPQKPTPPPPQKQVIEVRNYIPKTLTTPSIRS